MRNSFLHVDAIIACMYNTQEEINSNMRYSNISMYKYIFKLSSGILKFEFCYIFYSMTLNVHFYEYKLSL